MAAHSSIRGNRGPGERNVGSDFPDSGDGEDEIYFELDFPKNFDTWE